MQIVFKLGPSRASPLAPVRVRLTQGRFKFIQILKYIFYSPSVKSSLRSQHLPANPSFYNVFFQIVIDQMLYIRSVYSTDTYYTIGIAASINFQHVVRRLLSFFL